MLSVVNDNDPTCRFTALLSIVVDVRHAGRHAGAGCIAIAPIKMLWSRSACGTSGFKIALLHGDAQHVRHYRQAARGSGQVMAYNTPSTAYAVAVRTMSVQR